MNNVNKDLRELITSPPHPAMAVEIEREATPCDENIEEGPVEFFPPHYIRQSISSNKHQVLIKTGF